MERQMDFLVFVLFFWAVAIERTNSGFYLLFSPSNKTTKETTLKVIFIASVFSEIQGVFKEQKRSDIWSPGQKKAREYLYVFMAPC